MPDLLRLGKVKNLYLNQDLPKTDFMEDMIAQMKLVDGANKNLGWSNEIMAWRLELAADKLRREFNNTAVGHFEKKLRNIEASVERAKAHAQKNGDKFFKSASQNAGYQALAARKYDKPCSWCQKNVGKEFYGHSVDECKNKNRPGASCSCPDDGGGGGGRACHLCNAGY